MDLGKKGQVIVVSIMVAIVAFIIVVVMIEPLQDQVYDARNSTHMNCTNTTNLSTTQKATCVVLDMSLFYLIGIGLAASIAFITGNKNFSGIITAIFVFVMVTVLITPLKDLIIIARDATHLNCGATGISVGTNMACIVMDLWLFYFFIAAISAGVTYIVMKKVAK